MGLLREILAFLIIIALAESTKVTVQDINNLATKLLDNYRTSTTPSSDFDEDFVVKIMAYPLAVGNIDEVEEQLSTVLGFDMTWTDASIQWNPEEHNNITQITLGLDEVWKPRLLLTNPHQSNIKSHVDESTQTIVYNHKGETQWLSVQTLHTACDLDTTHFPFDIQHCAIMFISSDGPSIVVNASWNPYLANNSKENGAWKIRHSFIAESSYASLYIDFQFERKPMYMMLNVLLPIIMLALLTPLVFVMPKGSGERLGYSVTMLLAISVFMTIVSDNLPKNSDPMPLISIMKFVWYILNAVIVLLVIMNIKISHIKKGRRMPGCVCAFVRLTRRLTLCKKSESLSVSEDENEICLKQLEKEENESEAHDESVNTITWMEASVAIDKWCFVIVYILEFALPAVFLKIVSSRETDFHHHY